MASEISFMYILLFNVVNCIITSSKEGLSTLVGFPVREFIMEISILECSIGIISVLCFLILLIVIFFGDLLILFK